MALKKFKDPMAVVGKFSMSHRVDLNLQHWFIITVKHRQNIEEIACITKDSYGNRYLKSPETAFQDYVVTNDDFKDLIRLVDQAYDELDTLWVSPQQRQ